MKKKTNNNITTDISECQEDDEVLDEDTAIATVTTKKTTNETAENKMIEHQLENEYIEISKKMMKFLMTTLLLIL